MERQSPVFTVFLHVCAALIALMILAPFAWLFIMSISSTTDLISKPLRWWPATTDWSRYRILFDTTPNTHGAALMSALANSIKVAAVATVAALAVSVPAGWAVSRTPAVGWSLWLVIGTYMLPPVALAVPLYMGLAALGMLNTKLGLAVVYLTILAPFTAWLLKSGFDPIPRDLENAAAIDGARLDQVVSRMLWKFPGGLLRACEGLVFQAARSRGIGSMG